MNLTTYILRDIFMAKIEFHKDENGYSQVYELLTSIEERAKKDSSYGRFYFLILNGMDIIRRHGLPLVNSLVELQREDGHPYSIRLVKDLTNHVDLFEFRIDWKEVGAFRAIFFQFKYQEDDVIVMTKATIKDKTFSPEFEVFAKESELIKDGLLNGLDDHLHKGDNSNE